MASFNFTAEGSTEGHVATTADFPAVSGTTTFTAAAKHMGSFGYRQNPTGPIVYCLSNALATGVGSNAQRFRFYVRMSALPTSGNAMIFQTQVPNAANLVNVRVNPSGQLLLFVGGDSTPLYTSTFVVPLNTWVRIELVQSEGGGTTSTGIVGFGAVVGSAALTAVNSSTQAYFYATNASNGTTAGLGNFEFGKLESTSVWTCTLDWDDLTGDNSSDAAKTWTSNPSTWLGPGPQELTVVLAAASTAGMTVGGYKDLSPSVLAASATAALVNNGQRVQLSSMSAGAIGSLALTPALDVRTVLSTAALGSLAVLNTLDTPLGTWIAAGTGLMSLGAVRTQLGDLALGAGGLLSVGALRTQFATLPMAGVSVFVPIPNPGQSGISTLDAVASLALAGSKTIPLTLLASAAGALGLSGLATLGVGLSTRGTATLVVAGAGSRNVVWLASGAGGLSLGSTLTLLPVLAMGGISGLVILSRVFPDAHPYDNVLASVLSDSGLVTMLSGGANGLILDSGLRIVTLQSGPASLRILTGAALLDVLLGNGGAVLLDSGGRGANVLNGSTGVVLLSNGMIAVVQD